MLQEGNISKKTSINTSIIYKRLLRPAIFKMRADHKALDPDINLLPFFTVGLSLVLHPFNPMAPTVYLNYCYFKTVNNTSNINI